MVSEEGELRGLISVGLRDVSPDNLPAALDKDDGVVHPHGLNIRAAEGGQPPELRGLRRDSLFLRTEHDSFGGAGADYESAKSAHQPLNIRITISIYIICPSIICKLAEIKMIKLIDFASPHSLWII